MRIWCRLRRLIRRIPKPVGCEWHESCVCGITKSQHCEKCKFYFWLDSGYGYCRALPEFVVVAWCRDICSLYKEVKG